MEMTLDYRNAKYQGQSTFQQVRQGPGILIDDDLSLYMSHWSNNKLSGQTIMFISHSKYVYGQWANNQPHGLNVFRINDTIVLGRFERGRMVGRCVIIFEKINFIGVIQNGRSESDWTVVERGYFKHFSELVKFIEGADLQMNQEYFSLKKFMLSVTTSRIKFIENQENCYFGFEEGLGILFNHHNRIISVGFHEKKNITEFGGKFDVLSCSQQGNFKTKQVVKYSGERPKMQIYSVFQKIHKRSLDFKNQYFDSTVKLLTSVEQLVRLKIDEIVDPQNNQNPISALDLNDSLDFHAQNLQELNKISKINRGREQLYQRIIPVTNVPIERERERQRSHFDNSPCRSSSFMKSKSGQIAKNQAKANQIKMKYQHPEEFDNEIQSTFAAHSPICLRKQSSSKKLNGSSHKKDTRASITSQAQADKILQSKLSVFSQQSCKFTNEKEKTFVTTMQLSNKLQKISDRYTDLQKKPTVRMRKQQKQNKQFQYQIPFKYSYSQLQKKVQQKENPVVQIKKIKPSSENRLQQTPNRIDNKNLSPNQFTNKQSQITNKSPIKQPNYENLSERRKRILKQFKNLRTQNTIAPKKQPIQPIVTPNEKLNLTPSSIRKSYKYYFND